jgi:hypothetical protein
MAVRGNAEWPGGGVRGRVGEAGREKHATCKVALLRLRRNGWRLAAAATVGLLAEGLFGGGLGRRAARSTQLAKSRYFACGGFGWRLAAAATVGLLAEAVVRGWSWEAGRAKHATCKVALLRLRRIWLAAGRRGHGGLACRSGCSWVVLGGGPREARNLQSRATSPAAEWLAAGRRGHGGLACRRVVRGWSWEVGREKHATCKVALLRLRRNGWRLEAAATVAHLLTLNRNSMTSPSFTTYSLPSMRSLPASLAACLEPRATRSS